MATHGQDCLGAGRLAPRVLGGALLASSSTGAFIARRLLIVLGLVVTLGLVFPGGAASAEASSKDRGVKRSKVSKKTSRKSAKRRVKKPEPRSLDQALAAVRATLAAAGKAGQPSDLATLMIGTILETGFVDSIHAHYALAGSGQSLRSGAMSAQAVKTVATDMARNHKRLERIWLKLAAEKAFRGQLASLFMGMAKNAALAARAAEALSFWAQDNGDTARAGAFESALEKSRVAVKAFAAKTQQR